MGLQKILQAGWFPGSFVTALFFILSWTSFMTTLEWYAYGLSESLSPAPEPKDNLEIIAIDEASLGELGKWPWPRSYLGVVIKQLNKNGARTIGLDLPMHTPQSEFGVRRLDSMRDEYEGRHEKTVKDILFLARQRLDTDGALASSLKTSVNTVFTISYGLTAEIKKGSSSTRQNTFEAFAIRSFSEPAGSWLNYFPGSINDNIPELTYAQAPIEMLARHTDAGMRDESITGDNKLIRPLVLKYGDLYYPSFSLMFAVNYLDLIRRDITVEPVDGISLGDKHFDTDLGYRVYHRLYESDDDSPVFKIHSFNDVYSNITDLSQFRGKDVLIGITASSLADPVILPGGRTMPPVILNAHQINNLLHNDLYSVSDWALPAQLCLFIVVAVYLIVVLPRMRIWTGLLTSLLMLFIIVDTQLAAMMINDVWLPLVLPTITLACGAIAISIQQMIFEEHHRTRERLSTTNLNLGQHLQEQGQLDLAFEKYRECVTSDTLLDRLYNLGLEYERRRQFNKAELVFEYIDEQAGRYRDVKKRIKKNRDVQNIVVLNTSGNHTSQGTLILTENGLQKPVLGRYEVEKEIGRGAMGMVYRGVDPRIGRTVAIKTMSLSEEFESDDLADVKQRFLHEAKTAGRLSHPNIVTIYDAGEEKELAYIAMDFLKGHDLSRHKTPDNFLPISTLIDIAIQVASALDYAHDNDVIHRDIKPANIIYDDETGIAKVTDFGVACITSTSKTKTGTMLGSPAFMSPEQASGKKVNGSSDIFSLGATLYQLCTGKLPFEADSVAAVTHKICNETQIDASKVNLAVPACLNNIINKALQKKISDRYKTAGQMAKALRQCQNKI